MLRPLFFAPVLALAGLVLLPAQTAPAPGQIAGQIVVQVQASLDHLRSALAAMDTGRWHASGDDKQSFNDGQVSIQHNLQQATPGLLTGFREAPANLGTGFRLYRDLDALLAVAQREAELASQYDKSGAAADLSASVSQFHAQLQSLGDYLESSGAAQAADLQHLQQAQAAATAAAAHAVATPPPPTMVIDNANGTPAAAKPAAKTTTKPAAKTPAKPAPPPGIPHP